MRYLLVKNKVYNDYCIEKFKLNYSVDIPSDGFVENTHWLDISGWVYSSRYDVKSVAIYAHTLPRLPVAFISVAPRNDVADYLGVSRDVSLSFSGQINTLGLSGDVDLYIVPIFDDHDSERLRGHLSLMDVSDSWLAKISVQIAGGFKVAEGGCAPLLITSLGRSGSTVICKYFGTSARVINYDRYPSEARVAAYWLNLMRLSMSPADPIETFFSEKFLDDPRVVQACPFNYYNDYPEIAQHARSSLAARIPSHFRSIIEDVYKSVAGKEGARYFVEKSVPGTPTAGLAECCWGHAKEVILVRDPADWVQSALRFFSRKEQNVKNLSENMTIRQVLSRFECEAKILVDYAESRKGKSFILKYDDLVSKNRFVMSDLSSYLEIDDFNINIIDEDVCSGHRTSVSVGKSVGNIDNLTDVDLEWVNKFIGTHFQKFGYAQHVRGS